MRNMERIRYFEARLNDTIDRLRSYFDSREEIAIAILFGSALRRGLVRDIDIAIYATSKDLEGLVKMGVELEELLKIPIDLVPLDRILPSLRKKILVEGVPIAIKSRSIYTELLKTSIEELQGIEIHSRNHGQQPSPKAGSQSHIDSQGLDRAPERTSA